MILKPSDCSRPWRPRSPGLPELLRTPEGRAYATPAGWAHYCSGGRWRFPAHLQLLNTKLMAVEAGLIPRLLVQMPPRHGKSEFISKYFASWFLGRNPEKRCILTSYGADFAASWGRKGRDLLEEFGSPVFGVTVRRDSSAANRWDLQGHAGGMNTAGVDGPVTGKGGHLFLIDDPVKSYREALSRRERENAWEWYTSTAYTRLEPGGAIVLIMTRWHEDDMGGRILQAMADGGEHWDSIILPAIAGEDDPLGRLPGDPLWAERYDAEDLLRIKETISSFWFEALYQQRPFGQTGEVFAWEWFPILERSPEMREVYIVADTAISEKTSADFTVIMTGGLSTDQRAILCGMKRGQWEPTRTRNEMIAAWEAGKALYGSRMRAVLIEDTKEGQVIRAWLRRDAPEIPVIMQPHGGEDKVTRANRIVPYCEAGRVCLLEGTWNEVALRELTSFKPDLSHLHDDIVDAIAYLVARLFRLGKASGSGGTVMLGSGL